MSEMPIDKVHPSAVLLQGHEERIKTLEERKDEHQTDIKKLESKIDGQKTWLIGILVALLANLMKIIFEGGGQAILENSGEVRMLIPYV